MLELQIKEGEVTKTIYGLVRCRLHI